MIFDEYTSKLTSCRLLTASEERCLLASAQHGDIPARDRLVNSNMRLVASIAKSYLTSNIPYEDLLQEGSLGLLKAIEHFELSRNLKFSTYATQWVRQALGRAVDNDSRTIRLPAYMNDHLRKIAKAEADLTATLGEKPDDEALAAYLGLTVKKLRKILGNIPEIAYLDDPVPGVDLPLSSLLEDEGAGDPENILLAACETAEVGDAVSSLNDVERHILALRMDDGRQEFIQKTIGISKERIKLLEVVALRKLADASRTRVLVHLTTG